VRIGIVADTHNRVLASLFEALAGVEEIFHAGDICQPESLAEIETIAPVVAVYGNCDSRKLVEGLPEERRIERVGVTILLVHGHQTGRADVDRMAKRYAPEGQAAATPELVIFGHSHQACDVVRGGIRFFNPGTAGGVRYSPTVGILTIEAEGLRLEHVPLRR
jgi:putative phosphoesterase